MNTPIEFDDEELSNAARRTIGSMEPPAQRTYTPSQAVFAKSAGCFHWTPEGRRLYDYTSGVLVTNLGHNPERGSSGSSIIWVGIPPQFPGRATMRRPRR